VKTYQKIVHSVVEILEIVIIVFALSWLIKTDVLGFSSVSGDGMLPVLGKNNQVLVVKFFRSTTFLARGDIVVFRDEQMNEHTERLVGLPGDRIEIRNGFAYVNGKPTYEPYARTPPTYQMAPVFVPKNSVFVLNDNRTVQNDSKEFGSIPIDSVQGRAVMCYWPWSKMQIL